jgi:hypothetical protein
MNKLTFNLLPAILLWLSICCIASAQDVAQSDQITQNQQIIQDGISTTGKFDPVTVNASSTSNVSVQFPLTFANRTVTVGALDGGVVQTADSTINGDGNLSFSFQVSDRAGLYRVVVIDPDADEDSPHIIAIVQFKVAGS